MYDYDSFKMIYGVDNECYYILNVKDSLFCIYLMIVLFSIIYAYTNNKKIKITWHYLDLFHRIIPVFTV